MRRYPYPGKYEGEIIAAPLLHGLALDGWCDDECGEVDAHGWFGLIRGPINGFGNDAIPADPDLTADELDELAEAVGPIVTEDAQGFVSGGVYTEPAHLEADWASYLALSGRE